MKIVVQRQRKTNDGLFGDLSLDFNPFTCHTVENTAHCIPAGTYPVEYTYSPEFNVVMPLISVPERTGIRIHPANYPRQLLGCIAVGDKEEPDAVDNSRNTFNKLFALIKPLSGLTIEVRDIPVEPSAA